MPALHSSADWWSSGEGRGRGMEGSPDAGAPSWRGEGARLPAKLYSHSAPGHVQRGAAHIALLNRFLLTDGVM